MMRDYTVTWNGEEYVAKCTTILDPSGKAITGNSRHPGWALTALLQKLSDVGFQIVPMPRACCKDGD